MKRLFDIASSSAALLVLSPLFLIIILCIFFTDGRPVFFRQERIGKNEKIFKVYKFRTMKVNAPNVASAEMEGKKEYVTGVGSILRKTSLDELPQLLNILKGEMSVVGPRPLIPEEKNIHILRQKEGIYKVRPGLTGWAQVNGRDNVTLEEKIKLDKEYVEKSNIFFDFKIIFKTITVVLKREGHAD